MDGYVTGACYFCLEHTPIKWTGCGPMKLLLIINHVALRLRAETAMEREKCEGEDRELERGS